MRDNATRKYKGHSDMDIHVQTTMGGSFRVVGTFDDYHITPALFRNERDYIAFLKAELSFMTGEQNVQPD